MNKPSILTPAYRHAARGLAILAVGIGLGSAAPARADVILLQNDRKIQGTVDEAASDDAMLVIRTAGAIIRVPRAKVVKVEKQDAAAASAVAAPVTVESHVLDRLQDMLNEERWDEAAKEADGLLERLAGEDARAQVKLLKAQACIGLARQAREFVNYPQAEAHYRVAMENDPTNPLPVLELADQLQAQPARKADAIGLYESLLGLAGQKSEAVPAETLLEAQLKLGRLYLAERRFLDAGDTFLKVMQADQTLRQSQAADLAVAAYGQIKLTEMGTDRARIVESLTNIVRTKPRKGSAFLLMGQIYFDEKNWVASRDMLKRAVENIEPTMTANQQQEAFFNLGVSLRKLHADAEAASAFLKLLGMNPSHYSAMCELGEVRLDQGNTAEARRVFEQAMKLDGEKPRAYLGKGLALQLEGNYEDARQSFEDVLKRDATNAPARLAVARSWFAQEDWDKTLEEAEKVVTMLMEKYEIGKEDESAPAAPGAAPANAAAVPNEAPAILAESAATTMPMAAAPVTSDTAVTSGTVATSATLPAAPMAAAPAAPAAAGPATLTMSAEDEAELLRKASVEDRQSLAEALTLMGKANLRVKPTPKINVAREMFQQALRFDTKHADAFQGLGEACQADDMKIEAEQNFGKAVELDPHNPEYQLSLGVYWHQYRKEPAKALAYYAKYVELGGKNPQVQNWIKECGGQGKS